MKKIFITSNKYQFCLPGLQKQLNKYWGNGEADFTIIGFKEPNCKIEKNFQFISLGKEYNDSTPWYIPILKYFNSIDDEFFFLGFEDHFLTCEINIELMNECEKIMEEDLSVSKIRMHPKYDSNSVISDYNENFYLGKSGVNSYIPTSLRPAIWRKSFFIKLLTHPAGIITPHHFEVYNNKTSFSEYKILVPKGDFPIYADLDVMREGKINPQSNKSGIVDMDYYKIFLKEEDMDVFKNF